jgi:hypothetical protein
MAFGRETSFIRVFPSEEQFTTTRGYSDTFYQTQEVIDSQGRLYAVGHVVPFDKPPSWRDMGTSPYRVFVETKFERTIDVETARKIVSDLVRNPRSYWEGAPEPVNRALEHVKSFRSLSELIEGCSHYYDWP